MGIKDRLRRLEGQRGPELCPECGGKTIYQKRHADGTVTYPHGDEPCGTCDNAGWGGALGVIEVVEPGRDASAEGEEDTWIVRVWP